jgi:capsular polysaccharide export protein
LRGKPVHCHSLPFYAGWGLTHDRLPSPRRTRRLDLDELVYGALIRHPRYIDPQTLHFISPERALSLQGQAQGGWLPGPWQRLRTLVRALACRRLA